MDAIRTPRWVWACSLLAVSGCTWLNEKPATHRETSQPTEPTEAAQVVEDETPPDSATPDEDVNRTILDWVGRVDGAAQRPKTPNDVPRDRSKPPYAADITTQPAARASIEVVPEATPAESADSAATTPPNALEPPTLGRVAVHAKSSQKTATPESQAPEINAPAIARNAPSSLRELLDRLPPSEGDAFREQLDRRMLCVIAGDYEQARTPLNLVTAEQQELATRFVEAWIVVRDWHMGDQANAATAAAHEIAELQKALQRLSDLSVPVVNICSAVRGFGQYDVIEPARFVAGTASEFVLYCEVRDFVSEERDNEFTTTFDMTTTILNRAGDNVLELKDAQIIDRCRNRRHDCFIPRLVRLPATLSPGHYVAKVTIIDKLGQKVAENRATFQVVARP